MTADPVPVPQPPDDEAIHRYENGDCSMLAMAFRDLYGWEPLNLGGEHVVAADPDGVHAWDIRGRSPLDVLVLRWGAVEPWDPWATQAFGLSDDPAGDEHREIARLVLAAAPGVSQTKCTCDAGDCDPWRCPACARLTTDEPCPAGVSQ